MKPIRSRGLFGGRRFLGFALPGPALALIACLGWLALPAGARADASPPISRLPAKCDARLSVQALPLPDPQIEGGRIPDDAQPDLEISKDCVVFPGSYYFGHVNIIKGGRLIFREKPGPGNTITFWAKSIIIEAGGAMKAGVDGDKPFGTGGGKLDIVLYGPDQVLKGGQISKAQGAICASPISAPDGGPCGIPQGIWASNGSAKVSLPGGAQDDYFYKYGPLMFDDANTGGNGQGYFGSKTLGLSYDGTLQLRGVEGTDVAQGIYTDPADYPDPAKNKDNYKLSSATSWVRLDADAAAGTDELTLDRKVQDDWEVGDEIILTTTDYVPDHSEDLIITGFKDDHTIIVRQAPGETSPCRKPSDELTSAEQETCATPQPLKWFHNGQKFDFGALLGSQGTSMTAGMDPALQTAAETRAAVALLSRSIVIESGGDRAGETFADATSGSTAKHVPPNANYAMGGNHHLSSRFQDAADRRGGIPQPGRGRPHGPLSRAFP